MTDLIRTALLGTDTTGDDYGAFMRSVTVHGMRVKAGYVAPVLTCEGDTVFSTSPMRNAWLNRDVLVMDMGGCWRCKDGVQRWMDAHCIPRFNLYITYKTIEYMECCPCCGYTNDIPF